MQLKAWVSKKQLFVYAGRSGKENVSCAVSSDLLIHNASNNYELYAMETIVAHASQYYVETLNHARGWFKQSCLTHNAKVLDLYYGGACRPNCDIPTLVPPFPQCHIESDCHCKRHK